MITSLSDYINQIVCMDALDFLCSLPDNSVPLYLFSPPYNLGTTTGGGEPSARLGHYAANAPLGKRGMGHKGGKWDGGSLSEGYDSHDDTMSMPVYIAWQQAILRECWRTLTDAGAIYYNHKPRVLGGVLVEPSDYLPGELRPCRRQRVIWARSGGVNFTPVFYLPTYEEILIIARPAFRLKSQGAAGVGDVWHIPQETGTWHPAPFPLQLAERVIETTMPALIVDPFVGRGTTAVAAKRFGVAFIGNDHSPAYVEQARTWVAAERKMTLRQAVLVDMVAEQSSLFEEAV